MYGTIRLRAKVDETSHEILHMANIAVCNSYTKDLKCEIYRLST